MSLNNPGVQVGFEGGVRIGGKGARCEIGTPLTVCFVKDANIEKHADDQDTTNFESDGFDCGTTAIEGLTYDAKADWDANLNFMSAVPGVFPRDNLPQRYYTNVTDGDAWNMPYSRVLSAKTAIPTRALVSFDFSGKSNGPFSTPG